VSRRVTHRQKEKPLETDDELEPREDPAPPRTEDAPGARAGAAAEDPPDPEEPTGLAAVSEAPPRRETVEDLERECSQLRESLLRRRAEFENYKKRVERDRHTAAQEALAAVFREIVGTVDNLERALAAEGAGDRLREGVELTYRELVGLLESHRVLPLDPRGEPFDPEVHQALLHEPVPGLAEGTVAEVFRKGYVFGDRLLRPALVKVAKGEPEPPEGGDGDER
jgi:molecular chaperone GrpE